MRCSSTELLEIVLQGDHPQSVSSGSSKVDDSAPVCSSRVLRRGPGTGVCVSCRHLCTPVSGWWLCPEAEGQACSDGITKVHILPTESVLLACNFFLFKNIFTKCNVISLFRPLNRNRTYVEKLMSSAQSLDLS